MPDKSCAPGASAERQQRWWDNTDVGMLRAHRRVLGQQLCERRRQCAAHEVGQRIGTEAVRGAVQQLDVQCKRCVGVRQTVQAATQRRAPQRQHAQLARRTDSVALEGLERGWVATT